MGVPLHPGGLLLENRGSRLGIAKAFRKFLRVPKQIRNLLTEPLCLHDAETDVEWRIVDQARLRV
jgi:hypothetical protein